MVQSHLQQPQPQKSRPKEGSEPHPRKEAARAAGLVTGIRSGGQPKMISFATSEYIHSIYFIKYQSIMMLKVWVGLD